MAHRNFSLYGLDWCFVFSWTAVLTWLVVLGFWVISVIYGKLHLHRPVKKDDEASTSDLPGVTIVKPLNAFGDPNLAENLTSFFHLNYPKYELLFCIQDAESHELIKLVDGLMVKHPDVDAKMYIGAQNVGVNPKVNNMLNAYNAAQYPLFLISDAAIKTNEDSLTDMVRHMTEKVGLVHQLPYIMDGDLSFARMVEKAYFGGAHARIYLSANASGINCMSSMSCLFRKKLLDEEGGLSSLSTYLGEDFFLSQLMINKGWRAVLSSHPALQNSGLSSIGAYKARMLRWMYLRFASLPQLVILEPLTENIILGPLTSLAVQYLFEVPFYIFLPLYFLSWCIMDYLLTALLENRRPSYSLFTHMKAWIVRELLYLYLVPKVLTMRHVLWGGRRFRVRCGGKTELLSNGSFHSHGLMKV